MTNTLVIGYGNTLRGDAAAGVYAAEQIRKAYPGVECVTAQQLSPEMAVTLAHFQRVLFIDASSNIQDLKVVSLQPDGAVSVTAAQQLTPQMLLSASREMYGQIPQQTYQIEIPASDFTPGESLTPQALGLVDRCVEMFRTLFASHPSIATTGEKSTPHKH